MPKSREITFVLDDETDVFIDPPKDGIYHIRYIMPNGLPNVVWWSEDGKNDAFFDSNAIEAINKLKGRLEKHAL
ncbi:MAG: hypothetical protein ABI707_13175 [Ferruginibacter sp.]